MIEFGEEKGIWKIDLRKGIRQEKAEACTIILSTSSNGETRISGATVYV